MKENRKHVIKDALGTLPIPENTIISNDIPEYNSENIQGYDAYSLPDELMLLSMLNTIKLEPQFYRSQPEILKDLRDVVERVALKDPYFVAQAICWSRNQGEKMRSVNHVAAALLSPYISGTEYAKRFYGSYDRKTHSGGCIYRTDDMLNIKDIYSVLSDRPVSMAMKRGFKSALEKMDTYQLLKYKDAVINVANVVHPESKKSTAMCEVNLINGETKEMKTLDAIMQGYSVTADTWESANSEAGQMVAEAVREGKLDEETAKTVIKEAKNDNWEGFLDDGRLGVLAALRNIRSMLKGQRDSVINKLCDLVSDGSKIRNSGVFPYQVDLAYEVVRNEFEKMPRSYSEKMKDALLKGYMSSIPNLKDAMPGKTAVFVDCSGSMTRKCNYRDREMTSSCIDKAAIIAATIQAGTGADIVCFGTYAMYLDIDPDWNVFDVAESIKDTSMGCTNIQAAFDLIARGKQKYDRIIILSDNECNSGVAREGYKNYVRTVCNPYVYAVDLCSYGTAPVAGNKVSYYYGYGYAFMDDIARKEFDPNKVIDKVRKYVI